MRRPILTLSLVTCAVALASTTARAAEVTLAWDPSPTPTVVGYKIYYSLSPGPPYDGNVANEGPSPVDVPLGSLADVDAPQFKLTGIPSCTHMYFVATAYDLDGNESVYSSPPVHATIVAKPTISSAAAGAQAGTIVVDWSAAVPPDDSGTVDAYRLHYGTVAGGPYEGTGAHEGSSPVVVNSSPAVLGGLPFGATIHVAVEAVCSDGEGNLSSGASAVVGGPVCGNGFVEAGETCDGACPTSCDDGIACTVDVLTGSATTCDATCSHSPITQCVHGDGCCPPGCNNNTDSDCSPSCGNSVVETGETCDPPSSCPTSCDDGIACTIDVLTGSAASCSVSCSYTPITQCLHGDGCCPPGCSNNTDSDCSPSCGNGIIEPGETCDPPSSCPTSCDDGIACTRDVLTGSAANCSASCSHAPITQCLPGDGCCPPGCDSTNDSDCSPSCGNGIIEPGETCDPPSSCPEWCDDGIACTRDLLTGSAANCSASCSHTPITQCIDGDGCCPPGCDGLDSDCSRTCGNGIIEPGETCDPPSTCPTVCDDGNPCTIDLLTGSATSCSRTCSHTPITQCIDGDGCCPPGCDSNTDTDCGGPLSSSGQLLTLHGACALSPAGDGSGIALLLLLLLLGVLRISRRRRASGTLVQMKSRREKSAAANSRMMAT